MRLAPQNGLLGGLLDFSGSKDAAFYTVGGLLHAAPTDGLDTGTNVPNFGPSELIHVRHTGAAMTPGRLVTMDKDFTIADLANTANLGRPAFVSLTNFAAGSTTPQYGWVMRSGIAPVQYAVAATAGALFIGGAGQATPTPAAGKQILNAICLIAAASAFTRTVQTQSGSKKLSMSRVNGVFPGQAVSGTGIPGGTTVASVDPGGNHVILSAAATASGSVTGTFTPTGFGIVHFDRPFAQGQIT